MKKLIYCSFLVTCFTPCLVMAQSTPSDIERRTQAALTAALAKAGITNLGERVVLFEPASRILPPLGIAPPVPPPTYVLPAWGFGTIKVITLLPRFLAPAMPLVSKDGLAVTEVMLRPAFALPAPTTFLETSHRQVLQRVIVGQSSVLPLHIEQTTIAPR